MASDSIQPSHLRYEDYRFRTFRSWSILAPLSPNELAKAGFFYLNHGLEVICVFCTGRISDWESGDIAIEKHAIRFPDCPFIKNDPIHNNNVPRSYFPGPNILRDLDIDVDMDCMKMEVERLNSFRYWPLEYISPADLAKAGFFYLKTDDHVQCAFCQCIIMDWQRGDRPYIVHVNNVPLCPFLTGREVGNISLGVDECGTGIPEKSASGPLLLRMGINVHRGATHSSYALKDIRLRSFLSWPQDAVVDPEALAEAGFFYIGISDSVKCFYCNGMLTHWEKGDDPWVEHARGYPKCSFVCFTKGDTFIKSVRAKYANDLDVECERPAWDSQLEYNIEKPAIIPSSEKVMTLDNSANEFMKSTMVQAYLRSTSHPPYLVRLAILQKLQKTGTGVQNVDELCDAIYHVKDTPPHEEELISSSPLEEEDDIDHLKEAIRQLRDQQMCKICMDQEVGVVFLPCRHLITCVQCALVLNECAICRLPITGLVRTILS